VHHSEAQTTVVAQRSAARSQAATELQRALPVRVRGEFPLASKEQRKNYLPSWVTKLAYRHWILRSSPFTHSLAQEAQLSALRLHQSVSQSVRYDSFPDSPCCASPLSRLFPSMPLSMPAPRDQALFFMTGLRWVHCQVGLRRSHFHREKRAFGPRAGTLAVKAGIAAGLLRSYEPWPMMRRQQLQLQALFNKSCALVRVLVATRSPIIKAANLFPTVPTYRP